MFLLGRFFRKNFMQIFDLVFSILFLFPYSYFEHLILQTLQLQVQRQSKEIALELEFHMKPLK